MKKITPRRRYNTYSLVTLIVIALSFGYYYFFYIPQQEERFHEKGFRIIERIGENVEMQYENYNKIIKNYLREDRTSERFDSTKYKLPKELRVKEKGNTQAGTQIRDIINQEIIADSLIVELDVGSKKDSVWYSFKIQDLFEGKLWDGFFQWYIVFDTQKIYASDVAVSYSNVLFDSINSDHAFIGTELVQIRFDNNDHKMYVVPINLGGGYTIYLGGIVDNDFYRKQTHSLNPITVTVIIVFLILFILSIPLLKLLLISENERFKSIDAYLGFVAIIIGAAFFMQLLIFNYMSRPSDHHRVKLLRSYAEVLNDNYIDELNDALNLLNKCDSSLGSNATNKVIGNKYLLDDRYKTLTFNSDSLNDIMIFWADSIGNQVVKWGKNMITPRINIAKRSYFKRVNEKNLWNFITETDSTCNTKFYLEYVQSWTETEVYAMISKKSVVGPFYTKLNSERSIDTIKPMVVAMGLKFRELDDLNIIGHASYMLIGQDGKVLSHKDEQRNLQENIIEECNQDPTLLEALFGRKDTTFVAYYNSGNKLFYIKSVSNLPLYLLVYLDYDYEKLSDVQVLSFSSELYSLILLIILIQVGLFAIINRRRVIKTKANKVYFDWIWPNNDHRVLYIIISLLMIASYVIYYSAGLHHNLFHILSVIIVLLTTNLVILKQRLVLNLNNKKEKLQASVKLYLYYIGFIAISIILYHWAYEYDSFLHVWFYLILAVSLSMVLWFASFYSGVIRYLRRKELLKRIKAEFRKSNSTISNTSDKQTIKGNNSANMISQGNQQEIKFLQSTKFWYVLYLLILVSSLGFLPSIDSYMKAYRIEKELYIRNCQYSLLNNFSQPLAKKTPVIPKYFTYARIDTNYPLPHSVNDSTKVFANEYVFTKREKNLHGYLRYPLGNMFNNHKLMGLLNSTGDTTCYWEKDKDNIILVSFRDNWQFISSKFLDIGHNIWENSWLRNLIYIILVIILVYLVGKLLLFWSRRVFLYDIDPINFKQVLKTIRQSELIYVISPALCRTKDCLKNNGYVQEVIEFSQNDTKTSLAEKVDIFIKSYISPHSIKNKGFNLLVIDPFPHDERLFGIKAEAINKLKAKITNHEKRRLIILSNTHPAFTSKMFKDQNEAERKDNYTQFKAFVNSIGDFIRCYHPVEIFPNMDNLKDDRYGIFKNFKNKNKSIKFRVDKGYYESEDQTIKVQVESQNFMYSLWNNLEMREQHLVYDIAQNGLINYKNLPIIYNLMNKGILIRDKDSGALVIFNNSFRNFVLSIIDREEALQLETMAKRTGNWSNLRFPLIMIFIAAFALLFIAEQDVFNDVVGWLLAASASIPILMRTLATFGSLNLGIKKDS